MPLTRRGFLGASAVAGAALALPAIAVAAATDVSDKASQQANRAASDACTSGACPGVAGRVARHGKSVFTIAKGIANIETGTPMAPDGIFRIGSLTKQFTAALVLKLAAQGKLKLDDPAQRYLPFFPADQPFTLRELANQTAGIHSDESDSSCVPGAPSTPSQVDLARGISLQKNLFDFPPGTAWLYSNANYIVLGAVVEKVTGKPLAVAATEMIFQPLGLKNTAFDTSDAVVSGRVDGYSRVDGATGKFVHSAYIDIAGTGGAGAMRSCSGDLCRWQHELFANRLFNARWTQAMLEPGRLRDGRISGSHRFSPQDNASYGDVQYGMGLLIAPPGPQGRSVQHYGFINGFAAVMQTWLDQGLTMAVLCNADIGPGLPFRDVRQAVTDNLLPQA
jgi:CubicO group peptidase (beta-lactamase class C family)